LLTMVVRVLSAEVQRGLDAFGYETSTVL
jgi:hypothetical protein